MSETTFNEIELEDEVPTSYSSSTPAAATNRKAITAPGAGTGRRKEAVARVRLVPGTGRWVVNGKSLESYFPNKVHQQLVSEHSALLVQKIHTMSSPVSMGAEFLVKLVHYV